MRSATDAVDTVPDAVPRQFPSWPVGWYTVARESDLTRGVVLTRRLAGADVVLFRGDDGRVAAVAAHCPHMGTHLRHGTVIGASLRCPMHHWMIDGTGEVRSDGDICGHTRSWRAQEACGLVFVWVGAGEPGPLPLPDGVAETTWRSGDPIAVATPWFTLMISGFDMEHLAAVHGRRLVGESHIELLDERRLRLRYTSIVTGGGLADRVMASLGRAGIAVSMTCSGSVFTVDTTMGRRRTRAILGLLPVGSNVEAYGSFGVSSNAWFPRLQARIAAWLFIAFLRKDFAIIDGIALRTDVRDPGVRAMAAFLRSLPAATDG
ncbi:MAG: Rieske 2Fe-2S domain-containing protein [Gemmatimonas sp.]